MKDERLNDAIIDTMADAGDMDAKKEQLRRPVAVIKIGDVVPYAGEYRRVTAVADDGVTVTVGPDSVKPQGIGALLAPQFPPPGEPVLVHRNRAMRRAEAAGARHGAKARARMLKRAGVR